MKVKTSAVNVLVDAKVKEESTKILNDLGFSMSAFINIALKQVINKNGIPFEIVGAKTKKKFR